MLTQNKRTKRQKKGSNIEAQTNSVYSTTLEFVFRYADFDTDSAI